MRKDEGKEFRENQEKALKIMAEKDPEFSTDAAATNENMLARAPDLSDEELQASLDANNPTGSHSSYRDEKEEKADKRA